MAPPRRTVGNAGWLPLLAQEMLEARGYADDSPQVRQKNHLQPVLPLSAVLARELALPPGQAAGK